MFFDISVGHVFSDMINATFARILTQLPMGSPAWEYSNVRIPSPRLSIRLTTRHQPLHQRNTLWGNHPVQHVRLNFMIKTHGTSGGSSPTFGFSLLCTTKIANWVRLASRSDSGSACSSFSTSFRSSERAYLIIYLGTLTTYPASLTREFSVYRRFHPANLK